MANKDFESIQEAYGLSDEDTQYILDNYNGHEHGENILGGVWQDWDKCAYEEAFALDYCEERYERYFDFDLFKSDIQNWGNYLELPSGKVVVLNY